VILNISSNGDYESTETEYDPRQCVKQVANKHLRLTGDPSTNLEKFLRRLGLGGHLKPSIGEQLKPGHRDSTL